MAYTDFYFIIFNYLKLVHFTCNNPVIQPNSFSVLLS